MLRNAELVSQVLQIVLIPSQACLPIQGQDLACNIVVDIRITISIAANPGSELKKGGNIELLIWIHLGQDFIQPSLQVRYALKQGVVEEVKTPFRLLANSGLLQAYLTGQPQ